MKEKFLKFLCKIKISHSYTNSAIYRRSNDDTEEYATCEFCGRTGRFLKKITEPNI